MLAVIRSLKKCNSELRSAVKLTVLTDHKNLAYFTKPRMLNERQIRWSIFLGPYNMVLQYRLGKADERADALSRKEQDLPANADDSPIQHRYQRLLKATSAKEEEIDDLTDAVIMFSCIPEEVQVYLSRVEHMK